MYKSKFEGIEADRRLDFIKSIDDKLSPNISGTLPLTIDSIGGNLSDWTIYGDNGGVGEKQIVKGNLPLDFVSDGTNLENYRIYGTAEGAGETENLFDGNYQAAFLNTNTNKYRTLKEGRTAVIQCDPNTQYTISVWSGCNRLVVGEFETEPKINDTTNILVAYTETIPQYTTITTGANVHYIACYVSNQNNAPTISIVKGSTPPETYIPYGYKFPLTVTSGTETKETDIPIGDTKLMARDYIDYKSGKIYKAKRIHEDTVTIDGIEWDILDYDHDEVYKADGTRAKHTVAIQTHDIINNLQYSARKAAFAFPNGLAAGTYHFTVGAHYWVTGDVNKVLTFTFANAIPSGGQLVFNGTHDKTLVGTTISAFASPTSTTAVETVTMTEGDTGTDLGTMLRSKTDTVNSIDRALRGSNNGLESAMRQYLNSDKAADSVWTPQDAFDRPPEWASTTAGFLNGKSNNFISHIGISKKTTGLNSISDGGGTSVHDEKIFLLSRSEVFMGDEYAGGEGTPYEYYKNYSDYQSPSTDEDKNRIKYRAGTAHAWWLRSPNAGGAHNVWLVNSAGEWNYGTAVITYGVAPACCIVLDDMDDWVKQTFYTEIDADLPAIETFNGENTLDSTETLGETTITQGYHVPLDIRSENNEKHMDIYIGDSPLTEGQSVSRESTGVEIELYRGQSVIDTSLSRKFEMNAKIERLNLIEEALISESDQISDISEQIIDMSEQIDIASENADQIFRNKNDMGADRANIFKPKFTEKEYYGLTVTVNDDTTVTINGMKPGSGYDEISLCGELNPLIDPVPKKHLADGNYILYVEGDFDNDNDCGVSVMKYNRFPDGGFVQEGIAHRWANQSQQAFTIARDQECPYNCIYLYVKQGVQFNNKTAKISIRYPSSGSADTWQPYSPTLQEQIDQLKEQLSGGYNETQSDTITDEVTEVTQ